ncbi:MAG TPA: hypothetical protein VFG30_00145 [Polyangiales bacterium]|nr:hypothetical protein [Polyangiales bacterium]
MDVIVFRPHELPIALGALRATVRRLSLRQERYLESIAGCTAARCARGSFALHRRSWWLQRFEIGTGASVSCSSPSS